MSPAQVKVRLREAAKTFWAWNANQPNPLAKGYGNGWPDILRDRAESYGYDPRSELYRPAPPFNDEITRMWEAIGWLEKLPKLDRWIVWNWANETAMWKITQRTGKSRRTVLNWVNRACEVISGMLKSEAA